MLGIQLPITLEPPSARRLANDIPLDKEPLDSQRDVLWEITEDGTRVWKQPEDDSTKIKDNLLRVWQERGDFSSLTVDSIQSTPTESTEIGTTPDSLEDQTTKDVLKGSESISSQDLWDMKLKMAEHLNVIGLELSTGLDLLNIVLGPLDPGTVDTKTLPLPPGGLAPAIHSANFIPSQPESTTLVDAAVSLMRKQRTTKNVSDVLKQASTELGKEVERSREQWGALLELREGGWNLHPKGVKPGADVSLMGKGAERAAKEVGIAFANPEAAEALRVSSFASLEPASLKSSGVQLPIMRFPPRPRRRLVMSLVTLDGHHETFSPLSNYSSQSTISPTFSQDLEMAREEVLEEEIFSEVTKEAQLDETHTIITSENAVLIKDLGHHVQIKFEMVEKVTSNTPLKTVSPLARLMSSIMRLMMISIHRARRLHATGSSLSKPKFSQPKMLKPILDLIVFYTCTLNLRRVLVRATNALIPTQLKVQLECDPVLESASQIIQLLSATGFGDGTDHKTVELGGAYTLRICERYTVFFTVACPAVISLWSSHRPIAISPAHLIGILQNEIEECILSMMCDSVKAKGYLTRRVVTGFTCARDHQKIFVTVEFSFENGTKARAEKIEPNVTNPTHTILDQYEGQGSIIDWLNGIDGWT